MKKIGVFGVVSLAVVSCAGGSFIPESKRQHNGIPKTKVFMASKRLFPEELNILYDSKCNVCRIEIEFLRRRDLHLHPNGPKLKFTDLEDPNTVLYAGNDDDDLANGGIDYETGMKAMHAVTSTGKILVGVPVFVKAYQLVQLGWIFAILSIPGMPWLFEGAYNLFARFRTQVTRGQTIESLVRVHNEKRRLLQNNQCQACITK